MTSQQTPTHADGPTEETASTHKLGRSYYKLFGASTISNLGDGIGIIAYPWLASSPTATTAER
jgi:hypothetical protein